MRTEIKALCLIAALTIPTIVTLVMQLPSWGDVCVQVGLEEMARTVERFFVGGCE